MKFKTIILLFKKVKVKHYQKGDIIIPYSSKEKTIFFIRKGIVRAFHNHKNGNEITFQIFAENQVFSNIHSILLDQPAKFNYQALENTKVFMIDYAAFRKLSAKNEDLLEISRTFFGKKAFSMAFERVESFVFLSPEERYKKYLKDHTHIINRVPDMYIANILGITPVSLSRIRNRIASKKE
ncbi:MAG: Crp/Fnr family transcriptional regulator [Roseivirga sp.]